nr:alpha-1,2-fucosyltransferase [Hoylesella enoeca]
MDIVLIFNGLGNQMSQYAFYLAKRQRNNHTVYYVLGPRTQYSLDKLFGIPYRHNAVLSLLYRALDKAHFSNHCWLRRLLRPTLRLLGVKMIVEPLSRDFDERHFIHQKGIVFYRGGWHSELNFTAVADAVKCRFRFPEIQDAAVLAVIDRIKSCQSVSLHLRRGDYLGLSEFQGVCTEAYYEHAIAYLASQIENPEYFVFSDDPTYAREQFGAKANFHIIDLNCGDNAWRDLYMMSLCRHNIIANSTFSWWGAWLNDNPSKIVVHPRYHLNGVETRDFYPRNWICIE